MVFLSYEKAGHRPSGQQGRDDPDHDAGQSEDRRAGEAVRGPGNDQRAVLVARWQEDRVRQLSAHSIGARRCRSVANVD